jgi:hypothetical protein
MTEDYVDETYPTLVKWADPPKGCPWLDGQCLETRLLPGAYNRPVTYFRKDGENGLDAVLTAKAARPRIPEYQDLVYIVNAAKILNVNVRTLRDLLREYGSQTVIKAGKRKDGHPCWHAYVSAEFVEKVKADRNRAGQAADTMTVTEAAKHLKTARLKVTLTDVHNLIAAGLLTSKDGTGIVVRKARASGKLLRCVRKCHRVPKAEVEELRKPALPLAGQPADPRAPGRQPLLLRRAAEAIRDRNHTTTATRDAAGDDSAATLPPRRRGRKKGWRDQEAQDRDCRIVDNWRTGNFASIAELARKHDVDRSHASRLLKNAGLKA